MTLNNVDIYQCHFFTINNNGKIQFTKGAFCGKTPDDFKSISKLREVFSYCFWIMHTQETPLVSKYVASAFIKELMPKMNELERKLNKRLVGIQKKQIQDTKDSSKETGTLYGK